MTKKLRILSIAGLTVLSVATASLVPLAASANSGVSVNIGSSSEDGSRKGVSVNIGSNKSSDGDKDCGVSVHAGKNGENKGVGVKIGCEGEDKHETDTTDDNGDVLPAELPETGDNGVGIVASFLGAGALGWGIGELVRRRLAQQNV